MITASALNGQVADPLALRSNAHNGTDTVVAP
jgi:hypothetical protein